MRKWIAKLQSLSTGKSAKLYIICYEIGHLKNSHKNFSHNGVTFFSFNLSKLYHTISKRNFVKIMRLNKILTSTMELITFFKCT